jgi:hypothetical protein
LRRLNGNTLWLAHVGDLVGRQTVIDTSILAIVDLALEEPQADLPRNLTYCRFPLIDGPGNSASVIRAAAETVARFLRLSTPTLVL